MSHHYFCIGHKTSYLRLKFVEVLDPVGDEEHLSIAREFKFDSLFHHIVIESRDTCLDRLTIGWRGVERTQVACPHQRELKRARDRRRTHGQRVDIHFHLLEFLLDSNTEFLLFVDD